MADKIKGQRARSGERQDIYDVDALHELTDGSGNTYTLALDGDNNIIAVPKLPSTTAKVKGQRLDNGSLQEFYDVDAVHELTDENGDRYTVGLDAQNNVVAVAITDPPSAAVKIKGQRIAGAYKEFYDPSAIHDLTGADGEKYTIAIDELGDVVAVEKGDEPIPATLVTNGLIKRYRVADGKLMELVSNTDANPGTTYSGDTFTASAITYGALDVGSVEVLSAGFASNRSLIRFSGSGFSNGRIGITPGADATNKYGSYNSGNYYSCSGVAGDALLFGSNGSNSYLRSGAPKLSGVPYSNENMYASDSDRFTHGLYFDLNGTQDNSKKRSLNGRVQHNSTEANNIRPAAAENGVTFTFEAFPAYEVRFYNRMLTDAEIEQNARYDETHYSTIDVGTREHIFDGYAPFGGRPALKSIDAVFPNTYPPVSATAAGTHTDADGHQYILSAMTAYTEPERTENIFEGVKFISIPDKLYTSRKYSVVAMPYPFNGSMIGEDAGKFHIMYSSSDTSVCDCIDGVLIPKAAGTVTITARLAGAQLTDTFTKTVEVYDDSVSANETLYLHRNFSIDGNALNSKDSQKCAKAMFYAIKYAGENGYHRVVFPKMSYTIYPVFDYGSGSTCCVVPSNLIIDFSGSDIYIDESPMMWHSASTKYTLFRFTNGCQYSAIKNAVFHGERRNGLDGHAESDYAAAGCGIINMDDCFMCGTDHVDFYDTIGYYYSFGTSGQYDYYGGIRDANWTENSGLANRGRIRANEFELGTFDANGNATASDVYIRTKVMMHIGYTQDDLAKFCIGTMGTRYYNVNSRWVRVWWYDANQTLLNPGGTLYFQFSGYDLPSGAEYFKLSAYQSSVPVQNTGEDQCALRLYPYKHAKDCYANHLVCTNPNAWAVTITGGQNNYIANALLHAARRYKDGSVFTYAVDLEDNFQTIQSTVFDNVLAYGINLHGGHGNALVSCTTWSTARGYPSTKVGTENQCFRMIDCVAGSFYKSAKVDGVYRGNLLTTRTSSATIQGSLIETDIGSTGTTNLNDF